MNLPMNERKRAAVIRFRGSFSLFQAETTKYCIQTYLNRDSSRRLQQAAAPPSSALFAGYAVAFYIATYGSARSLLRRSTDGRAIFLRSLRELRCRILHCDLRFCLQLCCSAQQMAEPSSFACFASYAVAFFIAAKAAKNARNLYRNCPASAGLQFFS